MSVTQYQNSGAVSLKAVGQYNSGATTNIQLNAIRSAQGGKYWNPGDTQGSGQAGAMSRFYQKNYTYIGGQSFATIVNVPITGQTYVNNEAQCLGANWYTGAQGTGKAAMSLQSSVANTTVNFRNAGWLQGGGGDGGNGANSWTQGSAAQSGFPALTGQNISLVNVYNYNVMLGGAGGGGGGGGYWTGTVGGGGGGGGPGGAPGAAGLGGNGQNGQAGQSGNFVYLQLQSSGGYGGGGGGPGGYGGYGGSGGQGGYQVGTGTSQNGQNGYYGQYTYPGGAGGSAGHYTNLPNTLVASYVSN